jgi:hypothetical protein
MVGQPYNPISGGIINPTANGAISVNAPPTNPPTNPALADLPIPSLATVPASWHWVPIAGALPPDSGLSFVFNPTADIRRAAITGTPTEAAVGTHVLTFMFKYINDRDNLIIGETEPITITIVIHPRIAFDVDNTVIPDGMVGPGPKAPPPPRMLINEERDLWWEVSQPEPLEWYKGATIAAHNIPPLTDGIEWHYTSSQLPDTTPDSLEFKKSEDYMNLLHIEGRTTDNAVAGDRKLDIGFTIEHKNPNINGARVDREHTLRIWNRAYLTILWEPRLQNQFEADIRRLSPLEPAVSFGRAVIPGEFGRITAGQSSTDFVRWEVSRLYNPIVPSVHPSEAPVLMSSILPAGSWTGIGDRWGLTPRGADDAMSWMEIRMPMPASPDARAISVEITGRHVGQPRVDHYLPTGTLGEIYRGNFTITGLTPQNQNEILGTGVGLHRVWGLADGSLPPGLGLGTEGFFTGAPIEPTGIFDGIYVNLTLPGTMRIKYGPYSILTDRLRLIYGDVDGRPGLDLADLLLLAKFIHGTDEEIAEARNVMEQFNTMRNANIRTTAPAAPDVRDLTEIERWFKLEGAFTTFQNSLPND